MNAIDKQNILGIINEIPLEDLISFVQNEEISLDEMMDNQLLLMKKQQIEKHFEATKKEEAKKVDKTLKYQEINDGILEVDKIQELILSGALTKDEILNNTTITADLFEMVKHYTKFNAKYHTWEQLPKLGLNRTDVYFFGIPGSGKSCVLGGLLYQSHREGLIHDEGHTQAGTIYKDLLIDGIKNNILPDSTDIELVNYVAINIKDAQGDFHPMNFIEMSGEKFNATYEHGINEKSIGAKEFLNNENRKVIFFVIDFYSHQRKVSQSAKLESVLNLLERDGTLNKTDAINILVTKSDLFYKTDQYNTSRPEEDIAEQFVMEEYRNFFENCKHLKNKHNNSFSLNLFPFSVGEVKYGNILYRFNPNYSMNILNSILEKSFVVKPSKWKKLFN